MSIASTAPAPETTAERPLPVHRGQAAYRLRLFAVCVALFALALKQAPSQLVGDTKLDLSIDPVRFLGRALHLWDPTGDFGQTQNQGYGYLFPMGPFFALGHAVGLPAWAVQRLWWGVLLCLAFLGMVKLAERLGFGGPFSRVVGALAFALSPRVLSTLGPISVETLPYCLAPWVLVPLVTGSREGSPRRAAARSGIAVLCMGAVNAAAVLAALPPAALWLLTREAGPRRTSLQRWWVASVVLATCWWVVPLLLLGRYSPPFLDYIESASVTTSVTSLVEALRGTSDWVAYVGGPHGATWPTGFALLAGSTVIGYTVVVLAAGVSGLLRPRLPERRWLTLCLLLGVAAVTAGHLGPVTGLLAGPERSLLDGVLAPFRNVHKLDVVLRLPLALGLVHLLSELAERGPAARRRGVRLAAVAAVVGAALPALTTGLAPRHPFVGLPGYWAQTATWLGQHEQKGSALLLPGSAFPDYVWGSSNDEPLQPLARSRWAVRGAVPLTPAGTIRYLDAIEGRLATGTPSVGLADDLARAGIHYVVLRNDLAYGAAAATRPLLVHEAVAASPGLSLVAGFGGLVGGGSLAGYVDENLELPYQAVEVYEVSRSTPRAQLSPLSSLVRVAGGPEALLPLDDRFLLRGRPVALDADAQGLPPSTTVLTDSLRRREVFFGGAQGSSTSPTLTASDPYRLDAPAHDYLPPGAAGRQTVARLVGARSVQASSSASDAGALGGAQSSRLPFAAVDEDPTSSWRSDAAHPVAEASWSLRFEAPRTLEGLRLTFDVSRDGTRPTAVRVGGDSGSVLVDVPAGGGAVAVPGLTGRTSVLRVQTARTTGSGLGYLGLADVRLPGLAVSRTLDTPPLAGTPVISLEAEGGDLNACFPLLTDFLCGSTLARNGAESAGLDRTLHPSGAGSYRVFASAVPVAGPVLDAVLAGGTGVGVTASSSAVTAPGGRPGVVLDGDLGTGWRAASGDQDPSLTVTYAAPQTITGLRLRIDPSLASGRARSVRVQSADGTRSGRLAADGSVRFAALTTRELTVHLTDVVPATSLDPYSLSGSLLPVGVSELTVVGAVRPRTPPFAVTVPCSAGPVLRIGSTLLRTSARTDRATLQRQGRVTLVPCGAATADVGDGTRVVAPASALLRPVALTLRPALGDQLAADPPTDLPLALPRWTATSRAVALPIRAETTVLRVHENTNPGWVAELAGRRLKPVVLDGWQQGWVVPAGEAATLHLRYAPDRTYRVGLLVGAGAVVLLLLLAAWRGRRPDRRPPVPAQPAGGRAPLLLGGALLLLIGGWAAVPLMALAVLLPLGRVRVPLAAGAVLAAGGLLARAPWPTSGYAGRDALPQLLCVLALVVVWSSLLPERRLSFRRRAGRSTSR